MPWDSTRLQSSLLSQGYETVFGPANSPSFPSGSEVRTGPLNDQGSGLANTA